MNTHPWPCFILATVGALALTLLSGCVTDHGTATPGWWNPGHQGESSARFGLLLEITPPNEPNPATIPIAAK
jgi:hypothetical protein